jgi:PAS domain S-box-containing protein
MSDRDRANQQLIDELADLRRRVAEQEAELARRRLAEADQRQINNNLPVLVATAGFDGYYKEVNAAFERILGWSEQESLSRPFIEFIHPDDRTAAVETFERLKAGDTAINFEDRNICRDGSHRWIHWIVIPVPNRHIVFGIGKDITAGRRAQEALLRAKEELELKVRGRTAELILFQKSAEASGLAFGIADLEGRSVYVNPTLCRLCGEEKPEDIIGKHISNYCPEEERRALDSDILSVVLREGSWHGERVALSRDGRRIPVLEHAFLVHDENGTPFRLAFAMTDISEQKNVEEALRASEERFALAVEGSGDGICDWDLLAGRVYFSPHWRQIFGYQVDDIGERFEEWLGLIHPDDVESTMNSINDFLGGTSSRLTGLECRLRHKDGSYRWIESHAVAVRDDKGKAYRVVGSNGDITARKRAENALRQSHDELEAIYDGMRDGLLIADTQTKQFVRANAAICAMLGYSQEEILSKSVMDIHRPEDVPTAIANFQSLVEGRLRVAADVPVMRKDGGTFYADVSSSGVVYHGRLCAIGFFRDTTERKQVQDALERERQSLWRMLQASDHERQVIAYDIHDGLAQYLAAAAMQFQVSDSLRESSPEKAKKAHETAVELVRQAYAESRRLISEVRHPVIDERGLESAILNLVYEHRQRGGPRIECHTSVEFDRLPPILENAIYRMVQEALTNACKHSRSQKVTVSLVQEGRSVQLTVQDWGIGFHAEAIGGDHFGLESIRQRTRLLGGQLTIQSKPGSGTLVQVVVPILEKWIEE